MVEGQKILHTASPKFTSADIEPLIRQYALPLQEKLREAICSAAEEDWERSIELCTEILDRDDTKPAARELLGWNYFVTGRVDTAYQVFKKLNEDFPNVADYETDLGIASHAVGEYRDAAELLGRHFSEEEDNPFFYTSYGDALGRLGRKQESREVFYGMIRKYIQSGDILEPIALDGAFQNVLVLDIELCNGQAEKDTEQYLHFLDEVEMTEELQDYLADNIAYLSTFMECRWYRPLFLKMLTAVEEKGFLTGSSLEDVIESGYCAWESYEYVYDKKISRMLSTYFAACHKRAYEIAYVGDEEYKKIRLTEKTYEWYLCQYIPDHPEELAYAAEKYPHVCGLSGEFLNKLQKDPKEYGDRLLEELYSYAVNSTRKEFETALWEAYGRVNDANTVSYLYDGEETYKRMQPKIGRNDPCPCGSGKKYKKCCGKN